jgi:hypothetical protein
VVHVSGARGMTEDLLASGLYWTELRMILQVARSRSFNKAADELSASVTRRSDRGQCSFRRTGVCSSQLS